MQDQYKRKDTGGFRQLAIKTESSNRPIGKTKQQARQSDDHFGATFQTT